MKVAVTSKGTTLESAVDPRFGRAEYFIIVDTETFEFDVVDNNKNSNAFKGAGIKAAAAIVDKGADVLLTGFCGPNAYKALHAAGVNVANDAKGSVKDVVDGFNRGDYPFSDSPNTDGHW